LPRDIMTKISRMLYAFKSLEQDHQAVFQHRERLETIIVSRSYGSELRSLYCPSGLHSHDARNRSFSIRNTVPSRQIT
jgi:hypothetical protein